MPTFSSESSPSIGAKAPVLAQQRQRRQHRTRAGRAAQTGVEGELRRRARGAAADQGHAERPLRPASFDPGGWNVRPGAEPGKPARAGQAPVLSPQHSHPSGAVTSKNFRWTHFDPTIYELAAADREGGGWSAEAFTEHFPKLAPAPPDLRIARRHAQADRLPDHRRPGHRGLQRCTTAPPGRPSRAAATARGTAQAGQAEPRGRRAGRTERDVAPGRFHRWRRGQARQKLRATKARTIPTSSSGWRFIEASS